eukprot:1394219-Amorphochlora_amoeboformis.AAC.1
MTLGRPPRTTWGALLGMWVVTVASVIAFQRWHIDSSYSSVSEVRVNSDQMIELQKSSGMHVRQL